LRITPTPRHTEAHLADLAEALVDVWRSLDLPFVKSKIVPLRRPAAKLDAACVFPEMRQAAE
jgi:5-aminolevulinate synthase